MADIETMGMLDAVVFDLTTGKPDKTVLGVGVDVTYDAGRQIRLGCEVRPAAIVNGILAIGLDNASATILRDALTRALERVRQ